MANLDQKEPPEDLILPSKYSTVRLEALNKGARRKISLYLNLEGSLIDDIGVVNNYEGLAEQIGFTYLEIKNFELQKSPTEHLLAEWTSRMDLNPTIGTLWNTLKLMERVDVLTDAWSFIQRDCENYLRIKSSLTTQREEEMIQDNSVTQSTDDVDHHVDDSTMITVDDVTEGTKVMYDAFVCYNPEGEDLTFVREMIEQLEVKKGLKLFVPWRDDLPGASQNTITAKLIEQRCKRICLVISPRFLTSPSCDFQIKFAQSLSPGSRSKKMIPILIEKCTLPQLIRHITCCDYTKKELLAWFWNRLVQSLKSPLDPSEVKPINEELLSSTKLEDTYNGSQVSVYARTYLSSSDCSGASMSSMSSSNYSSSMYSSQSYDPNYIQPSSDDYAGSSGSEYSYSRYSDVYSRQSTSQPNSMQPPTSGTSKKKADYETISNIQRRKAVSPLLKPKSPSMTSDKLSPMSSRRPLPIPREPSTKDKKKGGPSTEYFC